MLALVFHLLVAESRTLVSTICPFLYSVSGFCFFFFFRDAPKRDPSADVSVSSLGGNSSLICFALPFLFPTGLPKSLLRIAFPVFRR